MLPLLQPVGISSLGSNSTISNPVNSAGSNSGQSFGQFLQSALDQVNNLQSTADRSIELAGAGAGPDLHTVMIQAEKAKLAIDLTVQIRNNALSAYQEIMRMQM